MNKKNNKPKRTFIPQAIGDTLNKINRNFSSKFGKIEFIVHKNWPEIAGSYFEKYSAPRNITRMPNYESEIGETIYKNLLNVSVAPAAAIEFQHFKGKILEKINSFFGYKAIFDLRIQQNYIPDNDIKIQNKKLTRNEEDMIYSEVEDLKNSELRESLYKLGKNITKEYK